jgi:hypothetical protein
VAGSPRWGAHLVIAGDTGPEAATIGP